MPVDINVNTPTGRPVGPIAPPSAYAQSPASGPLANIRNMWGRLPLWAKVLLILALVVLLWFVWKGFGGMSGASGGGTTGGYSGPGPGPSPGPGPTHPPANTAAEKLHQAFLKWRTNHPGGTGAQFAKALRGAAAKHNAPTHTTATHSTTHATGTHPTMHALPAKYLHPLQGAPAAGGAAHTASGGAAGLNAAYHHWTLTHHGGTSAQFAQALRGAAHSKATGAAQQHSKSFVPPQVQVHTTSTSRGTPYHVPPQVRVHSTSTHAPAGHHAATRAPVRWNWLHSHTGGAFPRKPSPQVHHPGTAGAVWHVTSSMFHPMGF